MRAHSVEELLRLPVRLHGIQLAQPTDLLLDPQEQRAIGFVVVCGDGSERFLPFPTAKVRDGELAVGSPLMLLAETAFYRTRAKSFRSLLGTALPGGTVCDVLLTADGEIELVLESDVGAELTAGRAA